ncbi:Amino-acid acetyltransferase [Gemmata obscuriglobus]|uniref:amino-acid N-acetyltransferase n=1 Tax=Gemmata obscuriglobus TaxID=114 RepID=A0A2Z3H7X5_9BACT|nr:amino-acid N-acetyltransferase [Gemmata obscuriglobus]AWM41798.1 amino-acid N-acetyltransferase [Gemmata obscuriglobus]QEG32238.1 Amino-acid acetyltransferase [Gemmata obscuriglobus]VTS11594.1 n-acetylglutamate synthase : Amino-acid N-acetyltransferase OS=Pedosphaera parvula (strain Ellin514) GN=Cflav_PD4494 PE=3 SV=1: AA_kinase: Acetyltransf_1 [Gemmata obscuriglobus UQM 2246]
MHERLTHFREILRYVPRFRDRVFVIALDGAVVEDDNFPNLLLDIALLRSLSIRVVLVHGAALQIKRYGELIKMTPSDIDGTGITDRETLNVAITAANRVTHEILEGLTANDLRAVCPNALVAHPAGILGGVDHLFTGRVERVDTGLLELLLERDIVPVIPPIGIDGAGASYRLNSDAVAVELAKSLKAVKLVYLNTEGGVRDARGAVIRQMTAQEADAVLKKSRAELPPGAVTKLTAAVRACKEGVERVHIIDGREQEGLLGEVFSNEGIGTLIHANEYQAIRQAQKKDVRAVFGLIQQGVQNDELLKRSRAELEKIIGDYFVFEVDRNPVACAALHTYPEENMAELASVFVADRYGNQGIGAKLIQFTEGAARRRGIAKLFCLSTQAINYFVQKGGYALGTPDDLPPARRERYEQSRRKSQVLIKQLSDRPA